MCGPKKTGQKTPALAQDLRYHAHDSSTNGPHLAAATCDELLHGNVSKVATFKSSQLVFHPKIISTALCKSSLVQPCPDAELSGDLVSLRPHIATVSTCLDVQRPVRFTNLAAAFTAWPGALGPMLSDHWAASTSDRPGLVLVFVETFSSSS